LLLVCSLLSLIVGTVVGLAQIRIKRLLAYSTISHVGFMLLALAVRGQDATDAFLFYLIQYSLTSLNAFFILLAFGYLIHNRQSSGSKPNNDVQFISELSGQFRQNPLLALSLTLCLFSMAGVPPLMGFFAKYAVLYAAIHNGYFFISVVAILASVISASYYLRVVRVLYFDQPLTSTVELSSAKANKIASVLTSSHCYSISVLTLFIVLFVLQPSLILNSTQLIAMSIYGY
jgi:NADH-ubiquinone oxidoreductase chain 2